MFATYQGGVPPKAPLEGRVRRWSVPAATGLLIGGLQEAKSVTARYQLSPDIVTVVPNPIDVHEWTPMTGRQPMLHWTYPPKRRSLAGMGGWRPGARGLISS